MVHENARRVRRDFFAHVFHRFLLFLPGRVLTETGAGKDIKAGLVADVALHRAEHS
jgi:hypothetical protein